MYETTNWILVILLLTHTSKAMLLSPLEKSGNLMRSGKRSPCWFYSSDSSSCDNLCIQADQSLFTKVLHNPDHVLHRLLPPVAHTAHNYCLRPRAHDRSLPERLTHLTDCNFIIRMLFYQVYWLHLMPACFYCLAIAFWQLLSTRICYVVLWIF